MALIGLFRMSQKWFSLIVEMTLLQKKETFTKQSHCAQLRSIFALSRSKGQISDWVLFHLKEKIKHETSLQDRQGIFKSQNSALFLDSWNLVDSPQLQVSQSSIPRKISASLTIISGPSFTSTYQVWGILQVPYPAPSVPSFLLHFMDLKTI